MLENADRLVELDILFGLGRLGVHACGRRRITRRALLIGARPGGWNLVFLLRLVVVEMVQQVALVNLVVLVEIDTLLEIADRYCRPVFLN